MINNLLLGKVCDYQRNKKKNKKKKKKNGLTEKGKKKRLRKITKA